MTVDLGVIAVRFFKSFSWPVFDCAVIRAYWRCWKAVRITPYYWCLVSVDYAGA